MEGQGSYGSVYSKPRFPFYTKYNFNKIRILEDDKLDKLMTNNEVSKIFYDIDFYTTEKNGYIDILKYDLPDILFNKPLHYGIININLIYKSSIYTIKWGEGDLFKKIIDRCYYQITFPRGTLIYNNNSLTIKEFYNKSFNLLSFIKYLNDNDFIYDDFKISNLLEIDGIYKISDFSTLIKVNIINKDIYDELYLSTCSYCIYLPIINDVIYKYLNNINKIYFKEDTFNDNKNYIDTLINSIINNIDDYILYVEFKNIDNNNIKINIIDILKEIKKYRSSKNNNDRYFIEFTNYLNNKYENNVSEILKDLSKRINLYSLGITLLNIFNYKKNFLYEPFNENSFQTKLFEIISYSCLNFIIIDDKLHIFEPNINFIIDKYKILE